MRWPKYWSFSFSILLKKSFLSFQRNPRVDLLQQEESEKVALKLNIQKMKIMASGPIPSWEIDGETVETVSDLIFWGSKITSDGDYSQEIKRHLLLGREVTTNLDSILKAYYFTNKGPYSQGYGFSVVMYGCESWTVKKVEC